jgi:hypothetical protein
LCPVIGKRPTSVSFPTATTVVILISQHSPSIEFPIGDNCCMLDR